MFKKEEKIILGCMVAIFAFVALVAIVMLFNDTVSSAKESTDVVKVYDSVIYSRVYHVQDGVISGSMSNIERYGSHADDMGYISEGFFWLPSDSWRPIDFDLYYNQMYAWTMNTENATKIVRDDGTECFYGLIGWFPTPEVSEKNYVHKVHKKVKRCKWCGGKNGKHHKHCGRKYHCNIVI